ncbi:MAG: hypothetical protein P4M00_23415 [Azospirillaceae bacterium]|nr:hypothetical protein [Azospirillaceae bacterium]
MYRTYNGILIGLVALTALCGTILVQWLQPLSGDLTRLGGYSENEFGWTGAEAVFTPPLAASGDPGAYYDVVVLGDSFSLRTTPDRQTRSGGFWVDFLAANTGLSVGVFFIEKMPPERLFDDRRYRSHPPRLVIVELVERSLGHQLLGNGGACPGTSSPGFDLALMPRTEVPIAIRRDVVPEWNEAAIGQAIDHLAKSIPRRLVGWDGSKVKRLRLSRDDLFTSVDPADLLVYQDDFIKRTWRDQDWAAMRCRLLDWQARSEANGQTRFLVVVAPDKSSAYAPYLAEDVRQPNGVAELAEAPTLHMPRVDLALRNAIQSGVKDVYLPNDTHWGSAGSGIVAKSVIAYLKGDGLKEDGGASKPTAEAAVR